MALPGEALGPGWGHLMGNSSLGPPTVWPRHCGEEEVAMLQEKELSE